MVQEPKHFKGNYYTAGNLLLVKTESTSTGQYFRGAEPEEYTILGLPIPDYVQRKDKVK